MWTDFPTHQMGHTLNLTITKENDTFCISEPVDKYYILDHSFVHSNINIRKPQTVRKTTRSRDIEVFDEDEIEKGLDKICDEIKEETSIDDVVGIGGVELGSICSQKNFCF